VPLAATQLVVGSVKVHKGIRGGDPAGQWSLVLPEPAARSEATSAFSTAASLGQPDRIAGVQIEPRPDMRTGFRSAGRADSRTDLVSISGIDESATFAERMAALVPPSLADPPKTVPSMTVKASPEPAAVAEIVPMPPAKPRLPPGEPTRTAPAPRGGGMQLASVSSSAVVLPPEERPQGQDALAALKRRVQPPLSEARRDDITGSVSAYNNPEVPRARFSDSRTAVYDITAHTVHLPNGERLEAHSGLGPHFDDPRSRHIRMRGVTPPNVYQITLRERPFHGVAALRMTPIGADSMFGRDGILAHTYMLGSRGESNGCVSFKNYDRFLQAFRRGEINRILVVARLDGPPASAVARIRDSDLRVAANGSRVER
jgi:hypothetical protein